MLWFLVSFFSRTDVIKGVSSLLGRARNILGLCYFCSFSIHSITFNYFTLSPVANGMIRSKYVLRYFPAILSIFFSAFNLLICLTYTLLQWVQEIWRVLIWRLCYCFHRFHFIEKRTWLNFSGNLFWAVDLSLRTYMTREMFF